jgi:hypothetical protein
MIIVEAKIDTSGTLVEDTGTDAQGSVLEVLARLEVAELGLELAQIVVDVELVGVRVGLMALAELLDGSAADLKVLVGVQVSLVLFGAGSLLLGRLCRCSGRLFGLLSVLFTLLLALLDWLPLSILCIRCHGIVSHSRSVLLTFSPVTSSVNRVGAAALLPVVSSPTFSVTSLTASLTALAAACACSAMIVVYENSSDAPT